MKFFKQFVIGGVIGIFIAAVALLAPIINFTEIVDSVIIGLLVVILLLWFVGFVFLQKNKRLAKLEVYGDEEDEVESKKYTTSADYMLLFQSSTVVALFVTSIAIIAAKSVILTLLGLAAIVLSYIIIVYSLNVVRKLDKERDMPNALDPEYQDKLFELADEGEKHVILQGLYKTYNLFNIAIVLGIVAATMYSLFVEQSQVFSIAVMAIVLLIVNGKYYVTIRKKA